MICGILLALNLSGNSWLSCRFGTKPIKLWFKKRHDLENMQHSVYREMTTNFEQLVSLIHTIKLTVQPDFLYAFSDLIRSREGYEEARKDNLFDQVPYLTGINRFYYNFNHFSGMGIRQPDQDMEYAEKVLFQVEQDLNTKQLDRKRFLSFLDKSLSDRIKRNVSCIEPFPDA